MPLKKFSGKNTGIGECIMARNREILKNMIKLALSYEEADKIMSEEYSTTSEKLAYLRGLFPVDIFSGSDSNIESDYRAALTAIVNEKWRAA
jgi:hypothetical protein